MMTSFVCLFCFCCVPIFHISLFCLFNFCFILFFFRTKFFRSDQRKRPFKDQFVRLFHSNQVFSEMLAEVKDKRSPKHCISSDSKRLFFWFMPVDLVGNRKEFHVCVTIWLTAMCRLGQHGVKLTDYDAQKDNM